MGRCGLAVVLLAASACGRLAFAPVGGDGGDGSDRTGSVDSGTGDGSLRCWHYRKRLTIPASRVTSPLAGFPVYVDLADLGADFFANIESASGNDGGDLRVTGADGVTQLPRQIVSVNATTGSGELHFKADALSSTQDTSFYIYYGDSTLSEPAANDTHGSRSVWTDGYVGIWHMDDATTSTVLDSSGRQATGTKLAASNPAQVTTGFIGNAQDFLNDTINFGAFDFANSFTISTWVNVNTNVTELVGILADSDGGGDTNGFRFFINGFGSSDGRILFETGNGTAGSANRASTNPAQITFGQWEHVAVTVDRAGGTARLYNAGADVTVDPTIRTDFLASNTWVLGCLKTVFLPMAGRLDEVRISSTIRSDAWIAAEHSNQSDPLSFYVVGPQEPGDPASCQ